MNKSTFIVLGSQYGDEGKGATTDYLCRLLKNNGTVVNVRFNGGHQAGHTVWGAVQARRSSRVPIYPTTILNHHRHVFSSLGSGSFQGAITYYSKHCTIYPSTLLKEMDSLSFHNVPYNLLLDEECMLTTTYDVNFNRYTELVNNHGSCGMGFGATVQRTLEGVPLYAKHLIKKNFSDQHLTQKLLEVKLYYVKKFAQMGVDESNAYHPENVNFAKALSYMKRIRQKVKIISEIKVFESFNHFVFEGAQGILLDQTHGDFPHVTRSNTTSRNALEMIRRYDLPLPVINLVTRCYQTRHGNGPMSNEELPLTISQVEETNTKNSWQGDFRTAVFDHDTFRRALEIENLYSADCQKVLFITCIDQIQGEYQYTKNGVLFKCDIEGFIRSFSEYNFSGHVLGDDSYSQSWTHYPIPV